MKDIFSMAVSRVMEANVKKGQIRSTVLRKISELKKSADQLSLGRDIKAEEMKEYEKKDPEKTSTLKKQVTILEKGIDQIRGAVTELEKYKDLTTA